MASLISLSLGTSLDLMMLIFLFSTYLAIQIIKFFIFFTLDRRCSKELWREIGWNISFQHSSSVGWLGSYRIWILMTSSDWLVLVLFGNVPLSYVVGIFFRGKALFWTCCWFLVRSLSVIFQTELLALSLFLYNSWKLSIGFLISLFKRSLLVSILSWYRIEEAFKVTCYDLKTLEWVKKRNLV